MAGRLKKTEKEEILKLYEDRYAAEGRSIKTVGWGSAEDQFLRFEVLLRGIDVSGKKILDVGCGLGDLVKYLDIIGTKDYKYIGIDLSRKLVADAQAAFGGEGRTFIVGDILEATDLDSVDIVLLSGSLNFRVENNMEHSQAMIRRMFELARETVSLNFLSSYVDEQLKKNFHYSPEKIFSFSKTLTPWVTLYHDYPLWEFTLQIHHQSKQKRSSDGPHK